MNPMQPSMNAVVFEDSGSPKDVLSVRSVRIPEPGEREVLVRVEARPIQPADFMFIEGRYRIKPNRPQIAGLEGTGVVVAAGQDVSGVSPGDRVTFRWPGSWADYATVPVHRLHVVPAGIRTDAAAQFSLNPITAWALLDEVGAQEGDWIAVNAATSGVARLARELARVRKISVVNVVGRGRHIEPGAVVVNAEGPDLAHGMLAATEGVPLVGLLDCIGGPSLMACLPALSAGATIVSYGVLEADAADMRNADMIYRNLTWKGFGIDHWLAKSTWRQSAMVQELWDAIRSGAVTLSVRSEYPLSRVFDAIVDATRSDRSGKVLLTGN